MRKHLSPSFPSRARRVSRFSMTAAPWKLSHHSVQSSDVIQKADDIQFPMNQLIHGNDRRFFVITDNISRRARRFSFRYWNIDKLVAKRLTIFFY
ncbi:hypothetical protein [Burkholderia plantarii]|uniref:hypothetical protein n=1 Tax=Burkholderia plantarii TaxID=41899 RepID=UPI0011DFDEE2|nr:hypothetical protein [Burkholderia plantarii]